MSAIETLLTSTMIQALGWALVHFIWQGAAIAALYALAKVLLRKRAANIRYAAACSALGLMLAAPVISLFEMSRSPAGAHVFVEASPAGAQAEPMIAGAPQRASGSPASTQSTSLKQWASERLALYLPWLLALWFAGVLFFSLRFAGGLVVAHRLRRRETGPALEQWQGKIRDLAERLGVSRHVRLCESLVVEVPTVIGWLRPVILLPASAVTGLSAAQIEALIAHELAHVRRYDYLINLLQTAVETLLFYHPAVWWVSAEIREEREHCCDDLAVAACGNVLLYARALAELEQLRIAPPRLAVAASGGSLLRRIQRLIGRPARAHRFESGVTGAVAVATILFLLAGAHALLLSKSQKAEASGPVATTPAAQSGPSVGKTPAGEGADQEPAQRAKGAPPQAEPEYDSEAEEPDAGQPIATEAEPISGDGQSGGSGGPQDFTGSMRDIGYANLSVDELTALDVHNITPAFAAEANSLLNMKLSVSQLVAFKVHGVTTGLIEKLNAEGLSTLTPEQLVAFRVHGVSPQFVSELKTLGYDNLPAETLTAFRVHGVSADYIRAIKELGYDRVSAKDLTAFRVHGVSPAFIQAIRGHLREDLSEAQLIAFRVHGVSEGFIKELGSLGYSDLSADQLTSARIHGVTPKFIEAMRSFGYRPTFDQLLQMKFNAVTPAFVELVRGRGFSDVTIDQLIELRRMNLIPGSRNK
ncbi:MAG TPA: M56 family metallopeptidase [Blastocatellia bacterium]|nr:M56 family metallopeptidase [Blastocatellia bacterium]